jgi:hypothetical protein
LKLSHKFILLLLFWSDLEIIINTFRGAMNVCRMSYRLMPIMPIAMESKIKPFEKNNFAPFWSQSREVLHMATDVY